jgi:hypothetical protein
MLMSTLAKQMGTSGYFDQGRHVPARRDGHFDDRHGHAQDLQGRLVKAKAIIFTVRLPSFESNHKIERMSLFSRRDAEQLSDVDYAEPPQFHMVLQQGSARANETIDAGACNLDAVVGNHTVAPQNKFKRALALADSRRSQDEHPQSENLHENTVDSGLRSQAHFKKICNPPVCYRAQGRGPQQ